MDSGPYTGFRGMVDAYIRYYLKYLGPFSGILFPIVPSIRETVLRSASYWSGVPIDLSKPYQGFINCSRPRRHIAIAHGVFDDQVPIQDSNFAINLVSSLPHCYDVTVYTPPNDCNGYTHHTEFLAYPDESREKLCEFWSKTFNQDTERCGLSSMIKYEEVSEKRMYQEHADQFRPRMEWAMTDLN